jgi:hypothetical protein
MFPLLDLMFHKLYISIRIQRLDVHGEEKSC